MQFPPNLRRWAAAVLALFLCFSASAPAYAAQLPEETTLPAAGATEPAETVEATVPEQVPTLPDATQDTLPPETEAPTLATEAPTEPVTEPAPEPGAPLQILTIAQAKAMPAGTEGITVRGTVVWASQAQAVIQDETGGLRLSFSADPAAVPGEILLVTGCRSGGLAVEDFASLGFGSLPVQEATLLTAPENLRVKITAATLSDGQISQEGFSMDLRAEDLSGVQNAPAVDAFGTVIDGVFHADSLFCAAKVPEKKAENGQFLHCAGLLHAHSTLSDGTGSIADLFQLAADTENLDFFAVSDHSTYLTEEEWTQSLSAAKAVTTTDFLGLCGYEVSWGSDKNIGHISTFHTPSVQSWLKYPTLDSYYDHLATVPQAISQFNHPGRDYGEFYEFSRYSPAFDQVMHLIELGNGENPLKYYQLALDNGWHLAPSFSQEASIRSGEIGPARTVVLTESLTEDALWEGIRAGRVYATRDPDLRIRYSLNGQIMGGTVGESKLYTAQVTISDPCGTPGDRVEIIGEGGKIVAFQDAAEKMSFQFPPSGSYYYLRVIRNGGILAVTAPVWVDYYEDLGIQSFTSQPETLEGEENATLFLTLYNNEQPGFLLESLEISAKSLGLFQNSVEISEFSFPKAIAQNQTHTLSCALSWQYGAIEVTAKVRGTVAGMPRNYEKSLTLVKQPPLSDIEEVRLGVPGEVYRIQGYLTSGSNNPYNTFPNTLYLQDDTGGIALLGAPADPLQAGCPLEATGILWEKNGNRVLELLDYALPDIPYYRYPPKALSNRRAMDYAANGGRLVQVEGKVQSLERAGNCLLRMTLQDIRGDLATVLIESNIRSGSYGTNELAATIKKGRTARAVGLVHVDEFGETVLRVRNCDEVVYVPAKADPTNPKTGDFFRFLPIGKK